MAKIILSMGDKVLQVLSISKERITIGRRPHNDVVIDDIAISANHAAIVTTLEESVLEDLNSTNGTQVNGQPVKKHFLQNHDVIELAKHNIRYLAAELGDMKELDESNISTCHAARIKVLSGASKDKEIAITKALTTIGRPGVHVAVIAQHSQEYYITHVEGDTYPLVNGQAIGVAAHSMSHGDVIDLSGAKMVFLLSDL